MSQPFRLRKRGPRGRGTHIVSPAPVAIPSGGERLLYRVVEHNPPEISDFLSDEAAGKARAPWETDEDHRGRSAYDLKRKAVDFAKFLTKRRGYQFCVAAVMIVPGSGATAWQSGPDPHHYTLAGEADVILRYARVVWPS